MSADYRILALWKRLSMASYFHEHSSETTDHLALARMIVEGGWTEQLGLRFDQLFPDHAKGAHPDAIKELESCLAEDMKDQDEQCPICIDSWKNADERAKVTTMPCEHKFHSTCLLVWLKKANSCPACRHELPSHDPLYEEYQRQQKRKEARERDIEELHNSMYS